MEVEVERVSVHESFDQTYEQTFEPDGAEDTRPIKDEKPSNDLVLPALPSAPQSASSRAPVASEPTKLPPAVSQQQQNQQEQQQQSLKSQGARFSNEKPPSEKPHKPVSQYHKDLKYLTVDPKESSLSPYQRPFHVPTSSVRKPKRRIEPTGIEFHRNWPLEVLSKRLQKEREIEVLHLRRLFMLRIQNPYATPADLKYFQMISPMISNSKRIDDPIPHPTNPDQANPQPPPAPPPSRRNPKTSNHPLRPRTQHLHPYYPHTHSHHHASNLHRPHSEPTINVFKRLTTAPAPCHHEINEEHPKPHVGSPTPLAFFDRMASPKPHSPDAEKEAAELEEIRGPRRPVNLERLQVLAKPRPRVVDSIVNPVDEASRWKPKQQRSEAEERKIYERLSRPRNWKLLEARKKAIEEYQKKHQKDGGEEDEEAEGQNEEEKYDEAADEQQQDETGAVAEAATASTKPTEATENIPTPAVDSTETAPPANESSPETNESAQPLSEGQPSGEPQETAEPASDPSAQEVTPNPDIIEVSLVKTEGEEPAITPALEESPSSTEPPVVTDTPPQDSAPAKAEAVPSAQPEANEASAEPSDAPAAEASNETAEAPTEEPAPVVPGKPVEVAAPPEEVPAKEEEVPAEPAAPVEPANEVEVQAEAVVSVESAEVEAFA